MRADEFFENRLSNTRGLDYKLYKNRNNNNVRANFFANAIVNVWNFAKSSISTLIFIQSNCQIGRLIGVFEMFSSIVYF